MKLFGIAAAIALAASVFAEDSEPFALTGGELVASGAEVKTIEFGALGGGAVTALPITIEPNCSVIPWKIEISGAEKTVPASTETVTEYTNYVCTATITNRLTRPYYDENGAVAGITNLVEVKAVTNNFATMPSAPWTMVSRAGKSVTRAVPASKTNAGGTFRLYTTEGSDWGTMNVTSGAISARDILNMGKIGFPGTMRVTCTEAERGIMKIIYLKLK